MKKKLTKKQEAVLMANRGDEEKAKEFWINFTGSAIWISNLPDGPDSEHAVYYHEYAKLQSENTMMQAKIAELEKELREACNLIALRNCRTNHNMATIWFDDADRWLKRNEGL